MRKFSIFIITTLLLYSNICYANEDTKFFDIQNHWAKNYIERFVTDGIINGYNDNTFKPNNNITTVEFLKMIISAGNIQVTRSGDNVWPDFYIETAKMEKLVPDDVDYTKVITRYDAAKILSNFIDVSNIKKSSNIFKDLKDEYKEDVLKLVKLKVISGYEDKTYKGEMPISRAEAVCVIVKAVNAKKENSFRKTYDVNSTKFSNYFELINKEQIGNNAKKILKNILNENTYTLIRTTSTDNNDLQTIIYGGKNKTMIENQNIIFLFTYFENSVFDLANSSLHDEFSNNCYMKIIPLKMWDSYYDFKNGIYADEFNIKLFEKALNSEFGASNSKSICKYMLEKNIQYVKRIDEEKELKEVKKFGKYTINFYKKEYDIPTFYVSK